MLWLHNYTRNIRSPRLHSAHHAINWSQNDSSLNSPILQDAISGNALMLPSNSCHCLISSHENKRIVTETKDRYFSTCWNLKEFLNETDSSRGTYYKSSKVGFQLPRQHFQCCWLPNTICSHQPQNLPRPWYRQSVTAFPCQWIWNQAENKTTLKSILQ
jgi:hypothetical protein